MTRQRSYLRGIEEEVVVPSLLVAVAKAGAWGWLVVLYQQSAWMRSTLQTSFGA